MKSLLKMPTKIKLLKSYDFEKQIKKEKKNVINKIIKSLGVMFKNLALLKTRVVFYVCFTIILIALVVMVIDLNISVKKTVSLAQKIPGNVVQNFQMNQLENVLNQLPQKYVSFLKLYPTVKSIAFIVFKPSDTKTYAKIVSFGGDPRFINENALRNYIIADSLRKELPSIRKGVQFRSHNYKNDFLTSSSAQYESYPVFSSKGLVVGMIAIDYKKIVSYPSDFGHELSSYIRTNVTGILTRNIYSPQILLKTVDKENFLEMYNDEKQT